MVEKTDVFEEITHASFTNSFMTQKNISTRLLMKGSKDGEENI